MLHNFFIRFSKHQKYAVAHMMVVALMMMWGNAWGINWVKNPSRDETAKGKIQKIGTDMLSDNFDQKKTMVAIMAAVPGALTSGNDFNLTFPTVLGKSDTINLIYSAIIINNYDILNKLLTETNAMLQNDTNLNHEDKINFTNQSELQYAIDKHDTSINPKILELLIDKDADVNQLIYYNNQTLLIWLFASNAIKNNSFHDLANTLINHEKIDFTKKDNDGFNALHRALENYKGDDQVKIINNMIKKIKEKAANVLTDSTNAGWPVLYYAVSNSSNKDKFLTTLESAGAKIKKNQRHNLFIKAAKEDTSTAFLEYLVKKNDTLPQLRNNDGNTALMEAIKAQNKITFDYLLNKTTSINDKNNDGDSALHLAVSWHEGIFNQLIEKNANLNEQNQSGKTPMMLAVGQGKQAIINILQKKGISLATTDNQGNTPLHEAVLQNNLETVKSLLTGNVQQLLLAQNNNGSTPLHFAVTNNFTDIAKILAAADTKGESFIKKDNSGFTPLIKAIKDKNQSMVRILADADSTGKSFKEVDPNDYTPLAEAVYYNNEEMVTILTTAIKNHKKYDSLTIKNQYGDTPLFHALKNGYDNLVPILANADLSFNSFTTPDNDGLTPLLYALVNNKINVVPSLISIGGALSTLPDKEGFLKRTPLFVAVEKNNIDIVNKLLAINESKDFINTAGSDGWTPLHWAASKGYTNIVKALLNKGADKDLKNGPNGSTAYQLAVANNHAETKQLLAPEPTPTPTPTPPPTPAAEPDLRQGLKLLKIKLLKLAEKQTAK